MAEIDSARQVRFKKKFKKSCQDSRPQPPPLDPPSPYDTLSTLSLSLPPSNPKLPLLSSPQGIALSRHPSRTRGGGGGGADLCVGKVTLPETNTCTPQAHTHRATQATYMCYITRATAYPSTSRSARCSATHECIARILTLQNAQQCVCELTFPSTSVLKR